MKLICIAFALVSVALAAPNTRLVGGEPTSIEEFPYVTAFIYTYPGSGITIQRCVGSIVSSWHVLCTAYCFTGANLDNMYIRAGSTNSMLGGETRTISDVIKHPDYLEIPRTADIAIVLLGESLRLSNTIGILFIPPQNTYIPDGAEVQVASWGFDANPPSAQLEDLHILSMYKVPGAECEEAYAEVEEVAISDGVICAAKEGQGICRGDSGAPMVIGQVVVGLSSYHQECGNDAYPDLFTRIDRFSDWILENAVAPTSDAAFTPVRVAKV